MKQTNTKNIFWIPVIVLFLIGFLLGIIGFKEGFWNGIYKTVQMFMLHEKFEKGMNPCLQWSRWILLFVFVVAAFQLFITIVAPRLIRYALIRFFYRNHIIICGLNKITINLVKKYSRKQIVVLAEETNKHAETLKAKNVKLLIGDFADESFWEKAKLKKASKLYAFIDNDKINVKIAKFAFSYLKNREKNNALKCFVLIKDREMKPILEELPLFKNKSDYFEGTLFNINEMGAKYGIAMNIDKILPAKMTTAPEILLVGLTEKTEVVLLNLAHCLTMQRETFKFTIVENDTEKIRLFEKQCNKLHLREFAEMEITNHNLEKICTEKTFNSILICTENQTEAIKQSIEIHYILGRSAPNIIVFCRDADTFNTILKEEMEKKKIFPIILFEEIADYIFKFDNSKGSKCIEEMAEDAHNIWRKKDEDDNFVENDTYDTLSEHFKQTNRNQVIDNFLRAFIARGKTFGELGKNTLFDLKENEKETLAIIEHRRWIIEKYDNGWIYDEKRDNNFKRHTDLRVWEKLSKSDKEKDEKIINLMINFINNQKNEC